MASSQNINQVIWAIVPAAGIGKRMQSSIPKQYLTLNGQPVLQHTLNVLLQNKHIKGLIIALHPDDAYFSAIQLSSNKPVIQTCGGKERADSVLNALHILSQSEQFNKDTDWVMVHDAVRACLRNEDIDKLVTEVGTDSNGGLLALPVRDTMKRQKAATVRPCVDTTIDRDYLWHALTPQYFPANNLYRALEKAKQEDLQVTDESSAMELAGFSPVLVEGHADNIKITRPEDLHLASLYLKSRK